MTPKRSRARDVQQATLGYRFLGRARGCLISPGRRGASVGAGGMGGGREGKGGGACSGKGVGDEGGVEGKEGVGYKERVRLRIG